MNSLRTPFGIARFSTSVASDPEAQRQHASFADRRTIIYLPKPAPLHPCARGTFSALSLDSTPTRSAVNTYFAISSPTFSRGTIWSRHDRPPAPSRVPLSDNLPPPYDDDEAHLPPYSEHIGPCNDDKPILLAKLFFKYGFVFPPFWFISILILFIPLTPPTGERDNFPADRATPSRRDIERVWVHRSLCAAAIFSVLMALTVAIFMAAMHAA